MEKSDRLFAMRRAIILIVVIVPFIATLFAIYTLWKRAVHWSDLLLMSIFYILTVLGVGLGFHRMLTHRSFQANLVIKLTLLILGSMSVEGPAIGWAATHIKHHALADREGDPHSPLDGLFHAHLGWLFHNPKDDADPKLYCRNLVQDTTVVFVSKTFFLWVFLSLMIPFFVGGWTGLLWGGFVRIFLVHHVTWSVNSICHQFGKREFETKDLSKNEWIIGMLALGEGWHNNHHAFPRSAFHGLRWWQFDLSGYIIRILEKLHLAHNVYRVPSDVQVRYSIRQGYAMRTILEEKPI